MATIEEILAGVAKQAKNSAADIGALSSSLRELAAAKKAFMAAGDPKGVLTMQRMAKAIEDLNTVTIEYKKSQDKLIKAQKEGRDLTEDELKDLVRVTKAKEAATNNFIKMQQAATQSNEGLKKSQAEMDADLLKNFRTNTLVGKSYSFLSGSVAKFTAGLTFSGLAIKALNRHMEAAEVQQNILIQSYRGVGTEAKKYDYVLGTTKSSTLAFTEKTLDMSTALMNAKATAERMGVSTEYVGDSFTKFARIVGTQSPKVLGTLTEGAITVSRALGISVPEAVDYVSVRMDKFGGSAAGAIASLNDMRIESERINKEFGRTVVRGDDVARTLSDISKETTMYAIDQRFVGNILRENIARLQANGASYEQASKQAKSFAEAATGNAPDWMKVFAGQDLSKQMLASFKAGNFTKEFGAELNAAKPGLAKEVQKLLKASGGKLNYSTIRAIQDMTSGSTVGIRAMSKEILKLAKHPEGITLIASQFHKTYAEAVAMVDQAKAMEERTSAVNKLTANGIDLAKTTYTLNGQDYKLTADQVKELDKIDKSGADEIDKLNQKKELVNAILDQKNEEYSLAQDKQRLDDEELMRTTELAKINNKITAIQAKKLELQTKLKEQQEAKVDTKGTEKDIELYDKMLKAKELEKTRFESKAQEAKGGTEGLKTVEDINKALLEDFKGYAINSGGYFKSIITKMSDTKSLLLAAGIMGLGKYLVTYTGMFGRIEKHLAKMAGADLAAEETAAKGGGGEAFGPQQKKSIPQKMGKWATSYKPGKYDAMMQKMPY